MEIWKSIPGWEEYQVSNKGNIKRGDRLLALAPKKKRYGHLEVELWKNGKRTRKRVSRLVAVAFVPNPNNLPQVNHKDENTANNSAENLEWCTSAYNCNYGTRNKRIAKANSRPVAQILNGVIVREWESARQAARAGFTHSQITLCCQGRVNHHKGYQWKYI